MKKPMKIAILLATVLAALLPGAAPAVEQRTVMERVLDELEARGSLEPARRAEIAAQIATEMTDHFRLTPAQAEAAGPVVAQSIEDFYAVWTKYPEEKNLLTLKSLKNETDALRAELDKSFEAILTPAQMEEYRRIQEERRAKVRARLMGGGG